jgi:phage gp29-like protein
LIHPVLGTRRVWPETSPVGPQVQAAGALQAAPARRFIRELPQQTAARAEAHAMGLLFSPVKPEQAKMILELALAGDLQSQWELFSRMEEWDRLAKNLNEVKNAVKRLSWHVQPYAERGEKPSASAQEKADLVEKALANWEPEADTLEYSFEDFIYNALDALGKGISVQEIHWQQRDGAIVPRAAHLLTPRQYGWNSDGSRIGLLAGGATVSPVLGLSNARTVWQPFPENQFVIGQWHARSGVPGATALLRSLVPYWIGATYGWRWLMQTAQLFGVPFRWATYDTTEPGLAETIGRMLENMGSSGWAAFPAGTTLEFKEAVTSARDNPQAVILELGRKACDLLILGQELSSESEASGLGSGNAVLQGKVRQDVLHNAAAWVANLLSYQVVLPVLRLNYGETSEAPCLEPDLSIDPDPNQKADRDVKLAGIGIKFPKSWIYERHGIPEPEEGEEVIETSPVGPQSPGGPRSPAEEDKEDLTTEARSPQRAHSLQARDATEKVIENTLESLTGVSARWLGGVKPIFRKLVQAAQDGSVSDAEFVQALESAYREMPELFDQLDHDALARALENSMGAACVNGAVQGYLDRKRKARRK